MGAKGSGRKARPTALRLIEGRKPVNPNEAKPVVALLEPPEELTPNARAEWDRVAHDLYELGLLSKIDQSALVAYCEACSIFMSAQRAIVSEAKKDKKRRRGRTDSDGLLIRTQHGNLIQNPAVGIRNKAAQSMVRYASEFGMTPASRSRIDVKKSRTDDPSDEFLD